MAILQQMCPQPQHSPSFPFASIGMRSDRRCVVAVLSTLATSGRPQIKNQKYNFKYYMGGNK